MRSQIIRCAAGILLALIISIPQSAKSIPITPQGSLSGLGLNFSLSVLSDLLANIIAGQLGIPVGSSTSLAETDFTSRNINTFGVALAYADGTTAQRVFAGSTSGDDFNLTATARSTQYPGTIGAANIVADQGFFDSLDDLRILGATPTTSSFTELQTFPPGPPSGQRTVAAAYGLIFANGNFIALGAEDSAPVPIPEPSTVALFLSFVIALGGSLWWKSRQLAEREMVVGQFERML